MRKFCCEKSLLQCEGRGERDVKRDRDSERHRAVFPGRQDSGEEKSMQCVTVSPCLYAQDIHVVPGVLRTHTVETRW